MKKYYLLILFNLFCIGLYSQEIIPFNSDHWNIVKGDFIEVKGEKAFCGNAILKNYQFQNGTIEWDMFTNGERSYPGILFRMNQAGDYEHFYVRPHKTNGLHADALQYTPNYHNISCWQLFSGEGYTSKAVSPSNEWVHYKLVVKDDQAKVFISDMNVPALTIHNLEHGTTKGSVSLRCPTDGSAYFANFFIDYKVNDPFGEKLTKPIVPGAIKKWEISQVMPHNTMERNIYPDTKFLNSINWKTVNADTSGMVNLTKLVDRKPGAPSWTYAKAVIRSNEEQEKWFTFGYSDYITVFLNGEEIYQGTNAFMSRDPSYQGLIGYFDKLNLKLKKGDNELLLAVGEQFGGWGFMFREFGVETMAPGIYKKWEIRNRLNYPESVVWDQKNNVLYTSNFLNNGREYLSKISMDGEIIETEWVKGLKSPTALFILNDSLLVVERNKIVVVDIMSATIKRRKQVEGALFLNDIVASSDGKKIFISDSEANKIYILEKGNIEVFLENELIVNPNAITLNDDKLLVGCKGAVFEVDIKTKQVNLVTKLYPNTIIDGIQVAEDNSVLISDFKGVMYLKQGAASLKVIINASGKSINFSDFIYIKEKQMIIVPGLYSNCICAYKILL